MRNMEGLRCCVVCRGEHYAAGLWSHEKCRVLLDERVVKAAPSSNKVAQKRPDSGESSNRKQGWERVKYNEYMRAYMARRRKEARNGDHGSAASG